MSVINAVTCAPTRLSQSKRIARRLSGSVCIDRRNDCKYVLHAALVSSLLSQVHRAHLVTR